MKKIGFIVLMAGVAAIVLPGARAETVWLRTGPFYLCNGEERKPKNADVTETSFTAKNWEGKANTISWSSPPAELRDGDEVTLTIESTTEPGMLVLGSWGASDCGEREAGAVWDGEAGSWKDAKRGANFNTGKSVFKFKPGWTPTLSVKAGRYDDTTGEVRVSVSWKYVKGEATAKKESEPTIKVEASVSPNVVGFNDRIQGVVRVIINGGDALNAVRVAAILTTPQGADAFDAFWRNRPSAGAESIYGWAVLVKKSAINTTESGIPPITDHKNGVHEIPLDYFKAPAKEGNLVFYAVATCDDPFIIATARVNIEVAENPKRIVFVGSTLQPLSPKVGDPVSLNLKCNVQGLADDERVFAVLNSYISGPEPQDVPPAKPPVSSSREVGDKGLIGHIDTIVQAPKPFGIAGDYVWTFDVSAPDYAKTSGEVKFTVTGDASSRGIVQGDSHVHLTAGSAQVLGASGEWIDITGDIKLPAGTRLKTGGLGQVTITFPDGAKVDVFPNTQLWINDGGNVIIEGNGSINEVVYPKGKGADHNIITPLATVEPTGTEFKVSHDAATGVTYVKVTQGEVLVTPNNKSQDPVLVRAGQKVWLSPRGFSGDVAAVESTTQAKQKADQRKAAGISSGGAEKTMDVEIPANKNWTATGIILNPGDYARIEAAGVVEASKPEDGRIFYHNVPPNGRDEFLGNMPQPFLRPLSLIGKIGGGSPVLPIGKYKHVVTAGPPFGTGELFLGINDDDVSDNSGAWKVRVTVVRKSSVQPASPDAAPKATEKTIEIEIPANRAWTRTGVTVDGNTYIRIQASGVVEASQPGDARTFYHNVPPEGRDEFIPNEPQPFLRGLSLLGKLGNGPALPVGKYVHKLSAGPACGSGELFLGINDDNVSDNSGAWKVRITIFSTNP